MNPPFDPVRDLEIRRVIRAPRATVWEAWADPRQFERWWVPAPERCRVVEMALTPGGAFRTEISAGDDAFGPHMDACFLEVEPGRRIVFTNALTAGWRPADEPFITAIITLSDHDGGTEYAAHVMHASAAIREKHLEYGFHDGWGTVVTQLAKLVERPA